MAIYGYGYELYFELSCYRVLEALLSFLIVLNSRGYETNGLFVILLLKETARGRAAQVAEFVRPRPKSINFSES